MSLYNMLFGQNSRTDFLLATVGLKENDVERLLDVSASESGDAIAVYTRTGGGNREYHPQLVMRHLPGWVKSVDDDFDSTYCTDTIRVDEAWRADVVALNDPLENGIRPEFAKHIAKTLRREPTDNDKEAAAYDDEKRKVANLKHIMANGHTFVPMDDYAMKSALELAEKNGGELRSCWGILPLKIQVRTNFKQWPNSRNEDDRGKLVRVDFNCTNWEIDVEYWEHCKKRFMSLFPISMGKIEAAVLSNLAGKK